MRSIRFSLKQLHLWVALYASLLAILLFAGYAAISMFASVIAMFLFHLTLEYFCSSKKLSWLTYLGTYSLAMASSIGVAFWALANVESAPPGDGFLAAFIKLADTSRTILISYYLIGFFLVVAMASLISAYIKNRPGTAKTGESYKVSLILLAVFLTNGDRAFAESPIVKPNLTLRGHKFYVSSVAFSPDGKTLASAGPEIVLWNPETGEQLDTLEADKRTLNFVRYSPDGRTLISARGEGEVFLWDVATRKHFLLLTNPGGTTNTDISRDGKLLAVLMNLKDIDIWDFATRKRLRTIAGAGVDSAAIQSPQAIQFSPDSKTFATAHKEGKVRLWNVSDGKLLKTISAYTPDYGVLTVAFSSDGDSLAAGATGSSDMNYQSACDVTLWDIESGKEKARFVGNKNGISDLAFFPDGRTIASGGHDATVRLWEVATGKPIAILKGHRYAVEAIAISPDGRRLASGGGDKRVCVWDLPVIEEK